MAQNANTVTIGGLEYAFKRVNLATMKKHLEFMRAGALAASEMAAGRKAEMGDKAFDRLIEMAEIVHECIVRAQPDVKLDAILEGLDQDNIGDAYAKVMQGSGYVPAGEPPAAAAPAG